MSAGKIPEGFKQTEIGLIPEDWDVDTIGESMRLINGRAFKPEEWNDYGLPIIRIQNLNNSDTKFNYFHGAIEDKHRIHAGDLLFAWSGTTGTSFGARIWSGPTGVLNQHIFKVIPDQIKVSPNYAFLVLQKVQESIEKQAHGFKASFVHVKKSDLIGIQLPLPPTIEEQKAIAKVLTDTDELIESLEQLIEKKRLIKKGAMQELLTGKRRLPGFKKSDRFKQTEIGQIPEDWEALEMGAIGQSIIGLTYKPTDVSLYGTLVLRSSNIQNGKMAFEDNVFVNMPLPERVLVRDGDILICVRNGSRNLIGKCALINKDIEGCAFGAFMSVYRSKYSNFIFYQFQSDLVQRQINEVMGATINQLTNKDLAGFKLMMPTSYEEQNAIATVLSDMDSEIEALEKKLSKYRQIKQGMMEKLLTGKIRLV